MSLVSLRGSAATIHLAGFLGCITAGLLAFFTSLRQMSDPLTQGTGIVLLVMALFAFVAAGFLWVLESEAGAVLACVVGFGFLVLQVALAGLFGLGAGVMVMATRRAKGFLL